MIENNDSIYFESISLYKNFLYKKIHFILQEKFPFLFGKKYHISQDEVRQSENDCKNFLSVNKVILDMYYLYRLKKRLSDFEFDLLMLLFYTMDDIKFNALVKKIKDPDKIPLSEDDYYELTLNEALELLIPDDKEKYLLRKDFIYDSYLFQHKIITSTFGDSAPDNPLVFNENLKLNITTVSKILCMESKDKTIKNDYKFINRLHITEDGF